MANFEQRIAALEAAAKRKAPVDPCEKWPHGVPGYDISEVPGDTTEEKVRWMFDAQARGEPTPPGAWRARWLMDNI
ncbi:MAG: hypothetical protein K2P57_05300 [Burkholderiales bacterium]|nr:hypothetical protein [Burkholderiales bacterium]